MRAPWGGPLEICHDHRRALSQTEQSWLLKGPGEQSRKKKRYIDLGCLLVSRKLFMWTVGVLLAASALAGIAAGIAKAIPKRHSPAPPPDQYTVALGKALMFFNAQKSGKLPKDNNVTWRGDSCLEDGRSDHRDLSGGYYDAGDAVKFSFPAAFSMTLLSWSVIEYSAKYEAAGELGHVRHTIKWGADYLLKTFNSKADTIDRLVAQVGSSAMSPGSTQPNDQYCWMRPEEIDYPRPVVECHGCPDLAGEMAAALAAASIVFRDDRAYSHKLLHGATTVWNFASDDRGASYTNSDAAKFYNSTSYYDELLWGASWMYLATGNSSYLQHVTDAELAKNAGAFSVDKDYGVFSWDNKLPGAQVLLSQVRLFLSPGYPYEEMLRTFHNQTSIIMCSYLPIFKSFSRTKGGLIQLNRGMPQPLQYVANAAFLASVFSDYLEVADTPGWYCGGPHFYSIEVLRSFARTQVEYILGKNPLKMSYVVGYGKHYPEHVHHRGASIPTKGGHRGCTRGWNWRDSKEANPHIITGAMVAGPDRHDGFKDVRTNRNYTEASQATLAGNAGLVAALVAVSGEGHGVDKDTMFSAVPPMLPSGFSPAASSTMETMINRCLEQQRRLMYLKLFIASIFLIKNRNIIVHN